MMGLTKKQEKKYYNLLHGFAELHCEESWGNYKAEEIKVHKDNELNCFIKHEMMEFLAYLEAKRDAT